MYQYEHKVEKILYSVLFIYLKQHVYLSCSLTFTFSITHQALRVQYTYDFKTQSKHKLVWQIDLELSRGWNGFDLNVLCFVLFVRFKLQKTISARKLFSGRKTANLPKDGWTACSGGGVGFYPMMQWHWMPTTRPWTDGQTWLKTLPSRKLRVWAVTNQIQDSSSLSHNHSNHNHRKFKSQSLRS